MSNWTFPLGAPADPRRDLPVFTLTPNWKGGLLERLEWLTDILISERAVEQRRALRRYPRRSFEASFLRAETQRSRLDLFRTGVGHKMCLLPLWHEQFKLGDGRTDGLVQFPAGSLAMREFRLNDLVLASTGDPDNTSLLTVTAVDLVADTITLRSVTSQGQWPPGTRITPLRRARVMDGASVTNPLSHVGSATVRFELADADPNYAPDFGWYFPLFRFVPDRYVPITNEHYRQTYVLDNSIGPINVTEPGDRAQVSASMALKLFGRDEVYRFRQFVHAARGKAVRFYVPTGQQDLFINADLGGSSFTTRVSGFYDYMEGPQDARKIIKVSLKDGLPPFYRTITNVEPILSGTAPFRPVAERFTLDEPLPNIEASSVDKVSFLVPSRFDQDSFELYHSVDDSAGVSAQVVTRSTSLDGMLPPKAHVTSRPYPSVSIDDMDVNTALVAGQIRLAIYDAGDERMNVASALVAGELRQTLKSYTPDPELMDVTSALVAGELRQTLKTYDAGAEPMDVTPALVTGVLKVALVTYDAKQESMDVTVSLLQGTLS